MTDEIENVQPEKTFSILESEANYTKMSIPDIIKAVNELDPEAIAIEVLLWAIRNVESYVESDKRFYQLNLILDSEDDADGELEMPEIRKLQTLYRSIPDDSSVMSQEDLERILKENNYTLDEKESAKLDVIINCKKTLDDIVEKAYTIMQGLDKHLETLYKRLIWYYEMVAVKDGKPIERELEGAVAVTTFEYDAFPMAVRVRSPIIDNISEEETGETVEKSEDSIVREYIIPEGFIFHMELAYRDVRKAASLF